MSSKLTDYNESYLRTFEDDEIERFYTPLNDFAAKSKLKFNRGKFLFRSNSTLNLLPSTTCFHQYRFIHNGEKSRTEFNHNSRGETSLEYESNLASKNNLEFGTYVHMILDQGEYRRNFASKIQGRLHFKDFFLFSLGVENWDFFASSPKTYSGYFSFGKTFKAKNSEEKKRVSFNTYLSYDNLINQLSGLKLYLIANSSNYRGIFEIDTKNTPNESSTTEGEKLAVNHDVKVNIKVNYSPSEKTLLGLNFSHDVNSKTSDTQLSCAHKVDRVNLIGKFSTDRTLVFGISSEFDDVKLSFAAKSTLGCKTVKLGENEITKHWVDYKFGVAAEMNRI